MLRFWPESGRLEELPVTIGNAATASLRAFPDGREITFTGSGRGGGPRLLALDLASLRIRELWPEQDRPYVPGGAVAISLDGRTVYASHKVGETHVIVALPRNGKGRIRPLLTLPMNVLATFDVSADGSLYMHHMGQERAILMPGPAGTFSEIPLPPGASGLVPLRDGSAVFSVVRGGVPRLLVAKPGAEPHPLLNTDEPASLPGVPVGEGMLAFLIGRGQQTRLAIGSVAYGRVVRRFPFDASGIGSVTATADGRTLFYASRGEIWTVPASGGEPKKLGQGSAPAAEPAGKRVYFVRPGENGFELFCMPAGGGSADKVAVPSGFSLAGWLFPTAVHRDGRILLSVLRPDAFYFRAAVFDPAKNTISEVPIPFPAVVNAATWTQDGRIALLVTRLSSRLWRYRAAR